MRPIWPQMSHIRPFSFKYHTKIAFCILRLLRGRFPIDLISLQNQGFKTLGSGLSTTLRVVELFLVQNVGLGRANFHIMGLWPQIQRYLWLWLDFVCARAKFANSWLDYSYAFYDILSFKKWANSESWQNFEWYRAIFYHILFI